GAAPGREARAGPPRPGGREAGGGGHHDRRPLARDPQPAQRRGAPAVGAGAADQEAPRRPAAAADGSPGAGARRDPPAGPRAGGLPPVRPPRATGPPAG